MPQISINDITFNGMQFVPVLPSQKAIFGFGESPSGKTNITNLVSATGVVSTDTTGVGYQRSFLAAASYGGDKAIFGFGSDLGYNETAITNLVSNTGVVASNTAGVGTARANLAATGYGTDKAIFGFGAAAGTPLSMTNLVSNTGVVASDTPSAGASINQQNAAATYGSSGQAVFAFGFAGAPAFAPTTRRNYVTNTGVVGSDTPGPYQARQDVSAAGYGTDKAIFGFGAIGAPSYASVNTTILVSNTGVFASESSGIGTIRIRQASASYGTDKAIFGYGYVSPTGPTSITNKVSNTGVLASDTTGVGTARQGLAAASFISIS